jgi:hypothetical protein
MLSFTALAQISFTTADFHSRLNNSQLTVFNNNYPVYPNVATGSASASSQTWNFGTLPSGFITDSSKQKMMPANKIPRSSYFPTANYGSYDSSFSGGTSLANSLFYQVADDGLYLVGMVQRYILAPNIDTILVSTIKPKQLTLPIPLALGVYRTYRDTMDSPGKREIRTDEFLVNGFGQ